MDNRIVAIGTDEQAQAFIEALVDTDETGAQGARAHLVEAGSYLRHGKWPESIRESIHAVESMALRISPEGGTLGKALDKIHAAGHLHGGLKNAFKTLYGYSSDEEGVRHAKVMSDQVLVDEAGCPFYVRRVCIFCILSDSKRRIRGNK